MKEIKDGKYRIKVPMLIEIEVSVFCDNIDSVVFIEGCSKSVENDDIWKALERYEPDQADF